MKIGLFQISISILSVYLGGDKDVGPSWGNYYFSYLEQQKKTIGWQITGGGGGKGIYTLSFRGTSIGCSRENNREPEGK